MQKKFFDIWNGKILSKYRNKLLNGDRSLNPCKFLVMLMEQFMVQIIFEAWKKLI